MEARFSKSAMRALFKSNKRQLIRQKIDELAAGPLPQSANVIRLHGRPEYRLGVQDWRVIFRIEDNILWIDDIGSHGSAYEVKS